MARIGRPCASASQDELHLELVPLGARVGDGRLRRLAVEEGRHVDPPRQDEAVELREERRVERGAGRGEDERDAAGKLDGPDVVVPEDVETGEDRLGAGRDADQGRDAHRRRV